MMSFRHRGLVSAGLAIVLGLSGLEAARAQDAQEDQASPPPPQQQRPASGPIVPRAQAHDKPTPVPRRRTAAPAKPQEEGGSKPPQAPPPAPTAQQAAPPNAPEPVAPQSVGEPIGELEPVIHARNAKITTCMDKIVNLSARVIDRPHSSVSTYVAAAPNDHVFQSIIGLTYPNKSAPNGAAIVLAAPINGSRCEGETVQIYPTTNSCTAVQASLINSGQTLTTLQSLPLLQTRDGNRELLLPTTGGGCVVVSIGLR